MPQQTAYERLVERLGEAGAKAEMARRRSFVKKPGLANVDKQRRREIMGRVRAAKHAKDENRQSG